MNAIIEKVNGIIYPQMMQLINLYSVQYINTGDRVKDGIITVLFNGTVSLLLSALYQIISINYKQYKIIQNKDAMDVAEIVAEHTLEKVIQYKHELELYGQNGGLQNTGLASAIRITFDVSNVLMWAKEKSGLIHLHSNSKLKYYCKATENTQLKDTVLYPEGTSIQGIFVPIKKYYNKKTNEYEYIFLVGTTIYSQSSVELEIICNDIYLYYKELRLNSGKQPNNNIYAVNDKFEAVVRGKISGNIVFDKMHFDEKKQVLEWLDKFQHKTLYPAGLCMTNKLGILLYGPPGTGKTGCISAIANKLNRHILIINSLVFFGDEGKSNFEQLLKRHEKTCVIVLDEFDYILNDTKSTTQLSDINYNDMLLFAEGDERKNILEMIKNTKKDKTTGMIDTPFILKLLDGIGNDEDRIIIATTNHPEKINKLFLRPGRFDVKVKLGFCSIEMFVHIVHCMYPEIQTIFDSMPEKHMQICKLLKRNITPLVLINHLVVSESLDHLLYLLQLLPHEDEYYDFI
jgi:hypothetical protein